MKGQKTHKGTKKRLKITKGKKVMFDKCCNNHLLTNKGKNHKKFPYGKVLSKSFAKKILSLSTNK